MREEAAMDGWVEWIVYTVLMAAGGVALLAFFTNPLLTLLALAAAALAFWVLGPSEPRRPR